MDSNLITSLVYGKGKLQNPSFPKLRAQHLQNIDRLVKYLQESSFVASSQSIVYQAIEGLLPSLENNISYVYWDELVDATAYLQNALNLTNEMNTAKPSFSNLYPSSTKEYIISVETDMPTDVSNWRNWQPIKIINHNITNLDMFHLDTDHEYGDTWVLWSINLPLLKYQYDIWLSKQVDKASSFLPEFILKYPMTNSLYSHQDIVLVNRAYNIFKGLPVDEPTRAPRGVTLLNLYNDTDWVYGNILDTLSSRVKGMGNFAENFPLASSTSLKDILFTTPEVIQTKQIHWAIILGSIGYLDFILTFCTKAGEANNSEFKNRINRLFRTYISDRTITSDTTKDAEASAIIKEHMDSISAVII